ncbi:hypothetical protein E1091_02345 [Micromonospora fluostatini]|uniref:Uncharacterized protein n=1 Tax=Micromonospora fluostatini TaxID=1629071 RepID=A0ABY2DL06_9ACTN|nr:hypothetical protein E1091_02345 [Micromonospora fluostatini]
MPLTITVTDALRTDGEKRVEVSARHLEDARLVLAYAEDLMWTRGRQAAEFNESRWPAGDRLHVIVNDASALLADPASRDRATSIAHWGSAFDVVLTLRFRADDIACDERGRWWHPTLAAFGGSTALRTLAFLGRVTVEVVDPSAAS